MKTSITPASRHHIPAAAWRLLRGIAFVLCPAICHGADVILVQGGQPHHVEEEYIRRLADFHGLTLSVIGPEKSERTAATMAKLARPGVVAIFSPQDSLTWLRGIQSRAGMSGRQLEAVPVLVFGVTSREPSQELKIWSYGAIQSCEQLPEGVRPAAIAVHDVPDVTRMLAGHELPAVASPACKLSFTDSADVESVLTAREERGRTPIMVRSRKSGKEVFFVPEMHAFDASGFGQPGALPKVFSSMAPFILFFRYAAGDYAWRLDGQYANFTIDDPWLTQPYGRLDYAALVGEMQKHNFHSTIGFVPWNFDRSAMDTTELFRRHPERLSIALHGNNHTHREFGNFSENPLSEQKANIKQAVARMEQFRSRTGLAYDRFMVFPHGVAPEATFAELQKYDFLGTANSLNVPLGSPFPKEPLFLLRSYTKTYGNLLSLFRYSAEGSVPQLDIALQLFMGNPLLFYGHESMFGKGMGAFNQFADEVNRGNQKTRWTSLGDIARHLYLSRRKADGTFEVQMFSNQADLKNSTTEDVAYNVTFTAGGSSETVGFVTADAKPLSFSQAGDSLHFRVVVRPHQSTRLCITNRNDLALSREDVSKNKLSVWALRWASDVRDLYFSRSSLGSAVSWAYYRFGVDSAELFLERSWWIIVLCIGMPLVGLRYRRWRVATQNHSRGNVRSWKR